MILKIKIIKSGQKSEVVIGRKSFIKPEIGTPSCLLCPIVIVSCVSWVALCCPVLSCVVLVIYCPVFVLSCLVLC
jgi:hypothetical protein